MSNVDERVKKIVVEQLGVKEDEVSNASSFVDDLGADSLDTVELVWKRNSSARCPTRKPRRSPRSSRPLITSVPIWADSEPHF
jgi:hypothetical protein